MNKSIYTTALFLLITSLCFAFQSSPTERIKNLNTSAENLIAEQRYADAQVAAEQALSLAQDENFTFGQGQAYNHLGTIAFILHDNVSALDYQEKALRLQDEAGDKRSIALTLVKIAEIYAALKSDEKAFPNYAKALEYLADIDDRPALAKVRSELAMLYTNRKMDGKAISELEAAYQLYNELEDSEKTATTAVSLGTLHTLMGNYENALTAFKNALSLQQVAKNDIGAANSMISIARLNASLGNMGDALVIGKEALRVFEAKENQLGIAEANNALARIYLKNKDFGQAKSNFDACAALIKTLPSEPRVAELYKSLADGFQEMKDFSKALDYSSKYTVLRDSLLQNDKELALTDLTNRYEAEYSLREKTRQVAVLKTEQTLNRRVSYLLIGLLALASLTAVLLYQSRQRKKTDNLRLKELNQQLREQYDLIAEKSDEIKVSNEFIKLRNDNIERWNIEIAAQKTELKRRVGELEDKNQMLEELNAQLLNEIRQREQWQQSSSDKDRFMADTTQRSHQPICEIVALSHLLLQKETDVTRREHLRKLQFTANTLLVMMNDMLAYSEIEAGKLQLENMNFSPEDVVSEVAKLAPASDNIKVAYHIDNQIPTQLHGDPLRFIQIMTHLLNGLKNRHQEGKISVNIKRSEVVKNELSLKIDLIAQGDNQPTELTQMIAILTEQPTECKAIDALQILTAKRLIQLQKGSLTAHHRQNDTAITLFLPFQQVKEIAKEEIRQNVTELSIGYQPTKEEKGLLQGKRILIAEDNKINQLLVINTLKKEKAEVVAVSNGIEAVNTVANSSEFDLILMDLQMPLKDGYEAVTEIRSLINGKQVPIVAITASPFISDVLKAQLFGMNDHLPKPYSADELMQKTLQMLQVNPTAIKIVGEAGKEDNDFAPQPA